MLIQFSAENYLSIRDKVTLSLFAGNDQAHLENLIPISSGEKENCLKSAVIYGANASGKSNVINAFCFMTNYVLTSHEKQMHKLTGRVPFKFDRETPARPSSFEVIFLVNGIRYAYGFSATETEITEEYLYHYPGGRQTAIFERTNTSDYHFTADEDLQNRLKDRTTPNKLYLSTAANWNYEVVNPVFEWFTSCSIICRNSPMEAYGLDSAALRDDAYRAAIVSMLQVADFGIQSLSVKETGRKMQTAVPVSTASDDIETVHRVQNQDGNFVSFVLKMAEESDGTNHYFTLAAIVKNTLDQGGLLVADEMDAHLHPLLTKHIVTLFNSTEHNPKGAQLIFTSHNTNLLDLELYRRDQVWFTEKDERTAATELFSLYDFSMHKDTEIEKGYLIGRFGAIPFIQRGLAQ